MENDINLDRLSNDVVGFLVNQEKWGNDADDENWINSQSRNHAYEEQNYKFMN